MSVLDKCYLVGMIQLPGLSRNFLQSRDRGRFVTVIAVIESGSIRPNIVSLSCLARFQQSKGITFYKSGFHSIFTLCQKHCQKHVAQSNNLGYIAASISSCQELPRELPHRKRNKAS